IDGMTCSSCAARIEKKLNRIDGVEATVNYATEQATVTAAPGVSVDQLVATVESAGYTARPAHQHHHGGHDHGPDDETSIAALRRRVLIATALAVPVVALSMVDPLRFRGW